MSDIKRWGKDCYGEEWIEADGKWVKHEDYIIVIEAKEAIAQEEKQNIISEIMEWLWDSKKETIEAKDQKINLLIEQVKEKESVICEQSKNWGLESKAKDQIIAEQKQIINDLKSVDESKLAKKLSEAKRVIAEQVKEIEMLKNQINSIWTYGNKAVITDCIRGHKFEIGEKITLIEPVENCESWLCENNKGERWCVFEHEAELTK